MSRQFTKTYLRWNLQLEARERGSEKWVDWVDAARDTSSDIDMVRIGKWFLFRFLIICRSEDWLVESSNDQVR